MATYARKLKDASGNFVAPATRASCVYLENDSALNLLTFFPIGAIYQSTGSTSPASLFGGSWEQITGRFLLGSDSSYKVSSIGGEETHKLTIPELPNYSLEIIPQDPGDYGYPDTYYIVSKGGKDPAAYVQTVSSGWGIMNWAATRLEVLSNEQDQPHNNMPPYYTVNIWRRTA